MKTSVLFSWGGLSVAMISAILVAAFPQRPNGLAGKSIIYLEEVNDETEVDVELANYGPEPIYILSIATSCRCALPDNPSTMTLSQNDRIFLHVRIDREVTDRVVAASIHIRYVIGETPDVYTKVVRITEKIRRSRSTEKTTLLPFVHQQGDHV